MESSLPSAISDGSGVRLLPGEGLSASSKTEASTSLAFRLFVLRVKSMARFTVTR